MRSARAGGLAVASDFQHLSVLADEVVAALRPGPGLNFLDGTLGGGGHAERLLDAGARVIGLDVDPAALAASRARLARFGDRASIAQATFADAPRVLESLGVPRVHGVFVDLGVSSPQLDTPGRGFSFSADGPLDMRMSGQGQTAAQLIAESSEAELANILFNFGEERLSRRIARAIKRATPSPTTTRELARVISEAVPRKLWPKNIHPATRSFQALRIAVNRELEALDALLAQLPRLLDDGGRAAIISFHSLEDRRVKEGFRDLVGRCRCPPGFPVCVCNAGGGFSLVTRKAIVASEAELIANPRSRSARLRVAERVR